MKNVTINGFTEGKATCNGDSGGPLILNGKDSESDTQVGIVSFGSSLGCNHLSTVFTRIDTKIDWVKSVLCEHSVSPPSYLNCNGVPTPLKLPSFQNLNKIIITKLNEIIIIIVPVLFSTWYYHFCF